MAQQSEQQETEAFVAGIAFLHEPLRVPDLNGMREYYAIYSSTWAQSRHQNVWEARRPGNAVAHFVINADHIMAFHQTNGIPVQFGESSIFFVERF